MDPQWLLLLLYSFLYPTPAPCPILKSLWSGFKSTISAVQLPCSITSTRWSSKHIWKLNHLHTLAHNHTQQYVTSLWQVCAEIGHHYFWNTGDHFSFPTLLPLASGLSHNTNGLVYMETKRWSKQKTKKSKVHPHRVHRLSSAGEHMKTRETGSNKTNYTLYADICQYGQINVERDALGWHIFCNRSYVMLSQVYTVRF